MKDLVSFPKVASSGRDQLKWTLDETQVLEQILAIYLQLQIYSSFVRLPVIFSVP